MGAYAYIFVAGFVIIGGLTSIAMRSDNQVSNHALYELQFKGEARDAAVTGMNLTVRRIVADEGPWTDPNNYRITETAYRKALYETMVVTHGAGDTVDVTSVGTKGFLSRAGISRDTTHTIEVRIIRADLAGGVPPGFDVAILTNKDMRLQGNLEVRSLDPTQNADIHANGTLETRGNSFLVEGYGTFTNGSRIRNGHNFQPNYDYNGSAVDVVQQDSIQIPPIDIAGFRTDAQSAGIYDAGDISMDQAYLNTLAGGSVSSFGELAVGLGYGPEVGSTPEAPLIIFSEGTIDFVGDVAMTGYGAFVSVGSIHINSNVNIIGEIGESFFGHPTTQMGIFTAGDAIINGSAVIQGTVYIDGAARFNGTASITGGAVMREISKMLGTFLLTWVGPNEGLVRNFGGYRTVLGPIIAAWAEW